MLTRLIVGFVMIRGLVLFAGEPGRHLIFEKNNGQAAADVRYLLRTDNYELHFKRGELVFRFGTHALRVYFDGQLNQPIPQGRARLDGLVRNINATDDGTRQRIQKFGSVKYDSLYAGIDLACYSRSGQLECDFIALPGANPSRIHVMIDGADTITIGESGALVIETEGQPIRIHKPNAYQVYHGQRNQIDVGFKLTDKNELGFETGEYNHNVPLIIDIDPR